jgi:copper transport protein
MTLSPGPLRRRPRALRLLLALAAAPLFVLLLAGPASAHATLLFATPTADGSVPDAPGTLTLVFNEPVSAGGAPVRVTGPTGAAVSVGGAALSGKRTVLTVPVERTLSTGTYTVDWQVNSDDGDTVAGRYRFAVGPALAGTFSASPSAPSTPGLPATVVARWLLYTALSVALGGLAVQALLRLRVQAPNTGMPQSWLLPAAVLGAAAAFATALLVQGGGSIVRGMTHFSPAGLLGTRAGTVAFVEMDAFILTALLAVSRRRFWAVIPLGTVAVAEGMRGHIEAAEPGWGAVLATVHLLAAALWAGGLVQAVRIAWAWRADSGRARLAVSAYARAALWLVAILVGTGTLAALVLLSPGELVCTGYGRILLAKIALVALALAFALAARTRLRTQGSEVPEEEIPPGLSPLPETELGSGAGQAVLVLRPTDREDRSARVFSVARTETAVLAAVLAISAVLTGFSPPRAGNTDLPFAPPAAGAVVPVGARAGLIGVHAQASTGQLVVRLTTPDSASGLVNAPAGTQLTGRLADPGGSARTLAFRRCGDGCFIAPATWRTGTSHLSLRTGTQAWTGGTTALDVPWPARPGAALLSKAVDAMRNIDSFTLYERTTSDTDQGPGNPMHIALTGQKFLQSEPYTEGRAGQAALGGKTTDGTVLLLGFPAENIEAALVVAPDGRILRETLTAPNHLVTRTFIYPEAGK